MFNSTMLQNSPIQMMMMFLFLLLLGCRLGRLSRSGRVVVIFLGAKMKTSALLTFVPYSSIYSIVTFFAVKS